jgi:glycosyltransferase involved in cell wall biosynthesis
MNGRTEVPSTSSLPQADAARPLWSVMIPTYNPRADYLEQSLSSVLAQDLGPARMQIQVVDDCSTRVDVASAVKSIAGERVAFSKNVTNLGLAGCWNSCIERSRGMWVHILHQDDYICPGFYERFEEVAHRHPNVSLIAARSFVIDEGGIITGVTSRLRNLEAGGRSVDDFFYCTPILCPGVVVCREFYERYGGFRSDLTFTLDCEMWARVIGSCGGVVIPDVLAAYRSSSSNATARLESTGEAIVDIARKNQLFQDRYATFDRTIAERNISRLAMQNADKFSKTGDRDAASANLSYWKTNTKAVRRLRYFIGKLIRKAIEQL